MLNIQIKVKPYYHAKQVHLKNTTQKLRLRQGVWCFWHAIYILATHISTLAWVKNKTKKPQTPATSHFFSQIQPYHYFSKIKHDLDFPQVNPRVTNTLTTNLGTVKTIHWISSRLFAKINKEQQRLVCIYVVSKTARMEPPSHDLTPFN